MLHCLLLRLQPTGEYRLDAASNNKNAERIQVHLITRASSSQITASSVIAQKNNLLSSALNGTSTPIASVSSSSLATSDTDVLALVPAYYPTEALTNRPQFDRVSPDDFVGLPVADHPGRIVVTLFLSAVGKVDRVQIDESSVTPLQEEWLVKQLGMQTLRPGLISGNAVPSKWSLEFSFDQSPFQSSPSGEMQSVPQ